MITSGANSRIKQLVLWNQKAKERKRDDVFLAEGVKMFMEAPTAWIQEVYVSEDYVLKAEKSIPGMKETGSTGTEAVLKKLCEHSYETVSNELFAKITDTKTPQGILCVLKRPVYNLSDICKKEKPLIMLIEDLQDPGNLGTIVRTGEGAGVDGVIMSRDTVDIFNPKTIRATMGSIYRMPIIYVDSLKEVIGELKNNEITVYAAHLKGQKYYDQFDYTGGTAFLIGNEGSGLKEETAALADTYLKIPMEGQVESLNAAVASSVLMYETLRQRRA